MKMNRVWNVLAAMAAAVAIAATVSSQEKKEMAEAHMIVR